MTDAAGARARFAPGFVAVVRAAMASCKGVRLAYREVTPLGEPHDATLAGVDHRPRLAARTVRASSAHHAGTSKR